MLEAHKKEIRRWLDNKSEPKMWVRRKNDKLKVWDKISFDDCYWLDNYYYIVDDEQANLRKIAVDELDATFEYYNESLDGWFETVLPEWNIDTKYRVKQKVEYPIFKVGNKGTDREFIVEFSSLTIGKVVFAMTNSCYSIGHIFAGELNHTDDCWEDVIYNSERGLFDKQPVLCWEGDNIFEKCIRFYDAKNDKTFSIKGNRDGFKPDNIIPYPHPNDDFIIEMYKNLKD